MKLFLTNFHYKQHYNIADYPLLALLFPLSLVYGAVASIRNFLYKKEILKTYKSPLYTIAVGNLTTGGTGKTPVAAAIAKYLDSKGEKVAILSRGYKGSLDNKNVNVISEDGIINHNVAEAGDEPFWLAKNCPDCMVVTCASRSKSAKFVESKGNYTKLVLDDGYQHQRLKRDMNLLVVDADKKFSNGFVLPLGALREPIHEAKRADKIIVVNKNFESEKAKKYCEELRERFKRPVFLCNMVPQYVYNIKTGVWLDKPNDVFAFSAVGQPQQFYDFLQNYNLCGTKDYPDHHIYTEKDIEELKNLAEGKKLVTTEKDAVKLREIMGDDVDIYALKLKPDLDVKGLLNAC